MVNYKKILALIEEGVSQRGIADALSCSRNTVASVSAAAAALGIGYVAVINLDNTDIKALLFSEKEKTSLYVVPDFDYIHKELAHSGVTLQMLWGEYSALCRNCEKPAYQYSFFCEQYRRWASTTKATMRISRTPADICEVDWAGDTMDYIDPDTGEIRKAYLFVASLSYSVYSYVEAFGDMKLPNWIEAHVHAFAFFKGTPRLLIPDNLRTGVSRASRYEPVLNPMYAQMADHYQITIIPTRVRKPKDKPVAEGSVGYIAATISATLRKGRFIGIYDLNIAIAAELAKLNAKPFQKREESREIIWRRDELPRLRELPLLPFEPTQMRKAKVAPNYHVCVDKNFYSVPYSHIGKTLDIRLTARLVEICEGGSRICSHVRLQDAKNAYATTEEHMPASHRNYLTNWSPLRFCNWAASIGPSTTSVTEAILAAKKIKEQSYRSLFGLLSLAKKDGGKQRLEQACTLALELCSSPSYTMIKRLWSECGKQTCQMPKTTLGDKGFVRGSEYFSPRSEVSHDR